ncbi:MAG: energy-coupling factor transporter transmembrane protein EcfT [Synergistaceae bacterium]|nr:energy-coupling factor transporter transmembrane protein EcfT [Synergistaceae bacterium]
MNFSEKISPQAHVLTTFIFTIIIASFGRNDAFLLVPYFIYPVLILLMGKNIVDTLVATLKMIIVASPFVLTLGIFGSWVTFYSLILRFTLTVSAMIILVSLIGFSGFCTALVKLKIPNAMITQMILMHRYSFLLRDEVRRLRCAHALRSGGNRKISIREFGSMAGNLLLRTFDRAEIIHQAMVCRGFNGTIPTAHDDLCWKAADVIYIVGWSFILIIPRF